MERVARDQRHAASRAAVLAAKAAKAASQRVRYAARRAALATATAPDVPTVVTRPASSVFTSSAVDDDEGEGADKNDDDALYDYDYDYDDDADAVDRDDASAAVVGKRARSRFPCPGDAETSRNGADGRRPIFRTTLSRADSSGTHRNNPFYLLSLISAASAHPSLSSV